MSLVCTKLAGLRLWWCCRARFRKGAVLAALRESRIDADDVAGGRTQARNDGNTLKRRRSTTQVCDFDGIETRDKRFAPAIPTGRMLKNKKQKENNVARPGREGSTGAACRGTLKRTAGVPGRVWVAGLHRAHSTQTSPAGDGYLRFGDAATKTEVPPSATCQALRRTARAISIPKLNASATEQTSTNASYF
jgi:hypothetical protein